MRGVVTLAAAFVLPAGARPHREVLRAGRLGRHGRHPAPPGLDPAAGSPGASTCAGPTRARTPSQEATVLQASVAAGLERARGARRRRRHEVVETLRARAEKRTNIVWERLGHGRPTRARRPSETYRRVRLRCWRPSAPSCCGSGTRGTVDQRGARRTCSTSSTSRSRCSTGSRTRADDAARRAAAARRADRGRRASTSRTTTTGSSRRPARTAARSACATARPGCTCGCAWTAATSAAATPPRQKHADAHFHETGHPVMRSFEPGEAWRWCFVDDQLG